MTRLLDVEYDSRQLIYSCNEEISQIMADMNDIKRRLEELNKTGAFDKLFHFVDIKRKKDKLKKEYDRLKQREKIVYKEREFYQKFGTKIPEGEEWNEMRKLLEARQSKLDIISMIDFGLM